MRLKCGDCKTTLRPLTEYAGEGKLRRVSNQWVCPKCGAAYMYQSEIEEELDYSYNAEDERRVSIKELRTYNDLYKLRISKEVKL